MFFCIELGSEQIPAQLGESTYLYLKVTNTSNYVLVVTFNFHETGKVGHSAPDVIVICLTFETTKMHPHAHGDDVSGFEMGFQTPPPFDIDFSVDVVDDEDSWSVGSLPDVLRHGGKLQDLYSTGWP